MAPHSAADSTSTTFYVMRQMLDGKYVISSSMDSAKPNKLLFKTGSGRLADLVRSMAQLLEMELNQDIDDCDETVLDSHRLRLSIQLREYVQLRSGQPTTQDPKSFVMPRWKGPKRRAPIVVSDAAKRILAACQVQTPSAPVSQIPPKKAASTMSPVEAMPNAMATATIVSGPSLNLERITPLMDCYPSSKTLSGKIEQNTQPKVEIKEEIEEEEIDVEYDGGLPGYQEEPDVEEPSKVREELSKAEEPAKEPKEPPVEVPKETAIPEAPPATKKTNKEKAAFNFLNALFQAQLKASEGSTDSPKLASATEAPSTSEQSAEKEQEATTSKANDPTTATVNKRKRKSAAPTKLDTSSSESSPRSVRVTEKVKYSQDDVSKLLEDNLIQKKTYDLHPNFSMLIDSRNDQWTEFYQCNTCSKLFGRGGQVVRHKRARCEVGRTKRRSDKKDATTAEYEDPTMSTVAAILDNLMEH